MSRTLVHARRWQRCGLSLAESVMALLIIAIMLTAALQTVGAYGAAQLRAMTSSRGQHLAQSMLSEILVKKYRDPDGSNVFGPETGERNGASRSGFDDVDDYADFSASPPTYQDGSVIPDSEGWRITVSVSWVSPSDPETVVPDDQGVKRIEVQAFCRDKPVAKLAALRADY